MTSLATRRIQSGTSIEPKSGPRMTNWWPQSGAKKKGTLTRDHKSSSLGTQRAPLSIVGPSRGHHNQGPQGGPPIGNPRGPQSGITKGDPIWISKGRPQFGMVKGPQSRTTKRDYKWSSTGDPKGNKKGPGTLTVDLLKKNFFHISMP